MFNSNELNLNKSSIYFTISWFIYIFYFIMSVFIFILNEHFNKLTNYLIIIYLPLYSPTLSSVAEGPAGGGRPPAGWSCRSRRSRRRRRGGLVCVRRRTQPLCCENAHRKMLFLLGTSVPWTWGDVCPERL